MAQFVAQYVAKKYLHDYAKKFKGKKVTAYDPLFVEVVDEQGRTKKVIRELPPYVPQGDSLILSKMRTRAYNLDCSLFNLFGVRFGWSSVLGIIPAAGDAIDAAMALLLVWRCSKVECGLGSVALVSMLLNVLLDFVVGLIPLVGDLADAGFKANSRNVRVLEKRLDEVYKPKGWQKSSTAGNTSSQAPITPHTKERPDGNVSPRGDNLSPPPDAHLPEARHSDPSPKTKPPRSHSFFGKRKKERDEERGKA